MRAVQERDRGSIKGVVLESRVAFLEERGGRRLVERVVARLTDEDRRVLSSVLLPVGWYDFEINERLDLAIARELGSGDAVFKQLGEHSARMNLGSSHRTFVRSYDPHGLLKQSAAILRLYYDTGRRTYEKLGDKKAVLRTYDCKSFSRPDCLTNLGWHEEAIRLCGGRSPRIVEVTCRAQGGAICDYQCEWT
jgi:hypothetical protein